MVRRTVRPEADCEWSNGYGIDATSVVTVTFNKDMDTGTLSALGGTMASEAQVNWADSRTLLISPSDGTWTDSAEHTVFFTCRDTEGLECAFDWIFGIVDHVYHVTPDGTPAASGRPDDPHYDINSVLWMAQRVYPGDTSVVIKVAEGNYTTGSGSGQAIFLGDGHTLQGGWNADFTIHDPDLYETVIDGQFNDPGSVNCTLMIEDCGPGSVLEGFTILGPRAEGSTYGIKVRDSEAEIRDNRIVIYQGNGLFADNSTCIVEDNQFVSWSVGDYDICFRGGDSVFRGNTVDSETMESKWAVCLEDTDMLFEANRISMASTVQDGTHVALYVTGGNPMIQNNIIDAHVGETSVGLYCVSASPSILNNTVFVSSGSIAFYGSGSRAYGLFATSISQPLVVNNLFVANGENQPEVRLLYCSPESHPSEARSNASYRFSNSFSDYDGDDGTNIETDDLHFQLDWDTWELRDGASAVLRTGGEDLSGSHGFSTDIDGTDRSGGWSLGAVQWQ